MRWAQNENAPAPAVGTGALILYLCRISIFGDAVRKQPVPLGSCLAATTTRAHRAVHGNSRFSHWWNVRVMMHSLPASKSTKLRNGHAKILAHY